MSDYASARSTDDDLDLEDAEDLAFKKLIYGLVDEDDTLEMGPVEAAVRIVDRIDDLEATNERLNERVAELESEVTPNPESKEYKALTKDEKVQRIRESLVEKGSSRKNGRFAMEYKDIMWLFGGNPSPGHTYDLMELAGDADGFEYQNRNGKSNRIIVNTDAVNDEAYFHAANNGITEEAA